MRIILGALVAFVSGGCYLSHGPSGPDPGVTPEGPDDGESRLVPEDDAPRTGPTRRIVVVVDTSDSMQRATSSRSSVGDSIEEVVATMGEDSALLVASAAPEMDVLTTCEGDDDGLGGSACFSKDPETLDAALRSLPRGSGVFVGWEALVSWLDATVRDDLTNEAPPASRYVVLVVTDEGFEAPLALGRSAAQLATLLVELEDRGATLVLSAVVLRSLAWIAVAPIRLTALTGGVVDVVPPGNPIDLAGLLR